MQIYAGAGGDITLKQPTFDNYALAAHYYGQTRKKFVVYPFDGVRHAPRRPMSLYFVLSPRRYVLSARDLLMPAMDVSHPSQSKLQCEDQASASYQAGAMELLPKALQSHLKGLPCHARSCASCDPLCMV